MSYTRIDAGAVVNGATTGGQNLVRVWRDPGGVNHLMACIQSDVWYGHYVNLTTGAHAMITGARGAGSHSAYNPFYDKLYQAGGYAPSTTEVDPVTMTPTIISNTIGGGMWIGTDNLVYIIHWGQEVYVYDPATPGPAGLTFLGRPDPVGGDPNYWAIGEDATHVYVLLYTATGGRRAMWSAPKGAAPLTWTKWAQDDPKYGGTNGGIYTEDGTGALYMTIRDTVTDTLEYYYLSGGLAVFSAVPIVQEPDYKLRSPYCLSYSADAEMPDPFSTYYGIDYDLADLLPIPDAIEESTVRYRAHGAPAWETSTLEFTGPWAAYGVGEIMPMSGDNVLIIGSALASSNGPVALVDYKAVTAEYLGGSYLSIYDIMRHSNGDVYWSGYSSVFYKWTSPFTQEGYTLRGGDQEAEGNNPRKLIVNDGLEDRIYHYRFINVEDKNGVVWQGMITTRKATGNYSNVMWHDPADESFGYMYDGWQALGYRLDSICAANSGALICVSSGDTGLIDSIDVDTKTIREDPAPLNLGGRTFMIEYAPDKVFGINLNGSVYSTVVFKPSTMEIISPLTVIPVSGLPFGYAASEANRKHFKLRLDENNNVLVFIGNVLYSIDPDTLTYTVVLSTSYAMIRLGLNGKDIFLY